VGFWRKKKVVYKSNVSFCMLYNWRSFTKQSVLERLSPPSFFKETAGALPFIKERNKNYIPLPEKTVIGCNLSAAVQNLNRY
jgi:hypothetical protein